MAEGEEWGDREREGGSGDKEKAVEREREVKAEEARGDIRAGVKGEEGAQVAEDLEEGKGVEVKAEDKGGRETGGRGG